MTKFWGKFFRGFAWGNRLQSVFTTLTNTAPQHT